MHCGIKNKAPENWIPTIFGFLFQIDQSPTAGMVNITPRDKWARP